MSLSAPVGAQRLGHPLFQTVNAHLRARGVKVATGTIVDATIITAPSSTKNADKARDPEMHQTAKGKQWYFGMKAHVGIDSHSKLIHSATATAALWPTHDGAGPLAWPGNARLGGSGLSRADRDPASRPPQVQDFTNRRVRYQGVVDPVEWARNRTKHNPSGSRGHARPARAKWEVDL